MTTQPAIGLLLGDSAGVGPQLAVRLLAEPLPPQVRLIVVGRRAWLRRGAQQAQLPVPDLPAVALTDLDQVSIDCPILLEPEGDHLDRVPVASVSREAGIGCMASLRMAADLVARGVLAGFLYGPMHKQSLQLGGSRHPDDAALLTELFECPAPAHEINILDDWCTSRVTSHIPLAEVPARVSAPGVLTAIEQLHAVMQNLNLPDSHIGVAGLNPHAGEGGLFGDEEVEVIGPAVDEARRRGIPVHGPFPPDTLFVRLADGQFGGAVTMYHDQGQIAIKLLGFARGVTVIGGLPVPVATTAHGTAFDIVEQGTARPHSLINALKVCSSLVANNRKRSDAS
ncbi:MAG: 4-hydroxythreonine-4-phosphate dehydrogenase PdxA [Caldilineaceae bacterium]|nr:4-hydroxythreonine-4-phosphate dehydrogenase PdxA [Caldilineaceae bacterium]